MLIATLLWSPRGIPADYRHMQGFGVNTYKWINENRETKLVKYHWRPNAGVKSLTADQAALLQGEDLGYATKDLYDAIQRGEYPEWELCVQLMDDDEHPEPTSMAIDEKTTARVLPDHSHD